MGLDVQISPSRGQVAGRLPRFIVRLVRSGYGLRRASPPASRGRQSARKHGSWWQGKPRHPHRRLCRRIGAKADCWVADRLARPPSLFRMDEAIGHRDRADGRDAQPLGQRSGDLAGCGHLGAEAYQIGQWSGSVLTTFGEVGAHFHTHVVFAAMS